MRKPLQFKPHHAEGAQRYMAWGKNESHKTMFDLLQNALDDDSEAELIFVRSYDTFCRQHCIQEGKVPDCVKEYGSESVATAIDEEVAREHGWKFDKPYKIRDILEQLRDESSNREIFYICRLTHKQHERWLNDVRASKKNTSKK